MTSPHPHQLAIDLFAALRQRLAALGATAADLGVVAEIEIRFRELASESMARESRAKHWSHCAVYRAPAEWPGPCDCGAATASQTRVGTLARCLSMWAWHVRTNARYWISGALRLGGCVSLRSSSCLPGGSAARPPSSIPDIPRGREGSHDR